MDNRPAYASYGGRFGGPVTHSYTTQWDTTVRSSLPLCAQGYRKDLPQ